MLNLGWLILVAYDQTDAFYNHWTEMAQPLPIHTKLYCIYSLVSDNAHDKIKQSSDFWNSEEMLLIAGHLIIQDSKPTRYFNLNFVYRSSSDLVLSMISTMHSISLYNRVWKSDTCFFGVVAEFRIAMFEPYFGWKQLFLLWMTLL